MFAMWLSPHMCISVNCVEIPLNVITSNVHKTVVFENVNVTSSAAYVSPIMYFMLETSPDLHHQHDHHHY